MSLMDDDDTGIIETSEPCLDFLKGSITRIKLKNFMTYSTCEFSPGPRLNLVLGANGTGKSSIVCAIALGFAGSPSLLGRQSAVDQFIKQGCQEGFIEIELSSGDGSPNPIIRRQLIRPAEGSRSRADLSSWFINNIKQKLPRIKEFLNKYGVQVDNMCQFLPQDKVGEFSKFDKYQLFHETVRAVLGQESVDQMEKLREARTNGETARKQFEELSKELLLKKDELQRLEPLVEQQRERRTIIEKLDLLKLKVPWLRFDLMRATAMEEKTAQKALKVELNDKKREMAPLDDTLVDLKKKLKSSNEEIKKIEANQREDDKHCKTFKQKYKTACVKSRRAAVSLTEMEQEEEDAANKLKTQRKLVQKLEGKLAGMEHPDKNKEELLKINETMAKVRLDTDALEDKETAARQKEAPIKKLITHKNKELQRLGNKEQQQIQQLKLAFNADKLIKQYEYVTECQNTGKAKAKIRGPLMLEFTAKNDMARKMLENTLNGNNLSMFLTENVQDRDLLNSSNFSLVNVDPASIKEPRRPFSVDMLARLNIDGYLDELVNGEPLVREALCRVKKLDQVLYAPRLQDKDMDPVIQELMTTPGAPKSLTLFTQTSKVTSKVSRYTQQTVTSVIALKDGAGPQGKRLVKVHAGADATSATGGGRITKKKKKTNSTGGGGSMDSDGDDDEEEDQRPPEVILAEAIGELKAELAALQQSNIELIKERGLIKERTNECNEMKKELREAKAVFNRMEIRLEKARLQLADLEGQEDRDWDEEKRKKGRVLKQWMGAERESLSRWRDSLVKGNDDVLSMCLKTLSTAGTRSEIIALENTIREHEQDLEAKERKYHQARAAYESSMSEVKKLRKLAEEIAPLTEELSEQFGTIPNDLDELVASAREMENALEMMVEQHDVLLKFNACEEKIAELEPKVEALGKEVDDMEDDVKTLRREFDQLVETMVEEIGVRFEKLFEDVRKGGGFECAGAIALDKDEGTNIDQYGIAIKVKFRKDQHLEMLSASVQSGGERSLSTFLYILALQQSTQCPFRLADEINQGMDAEKERLAYNCLLREVTGGPRAQYFLITPKLLRGLKYTRDTTVLFVFNGSHSLTQPMFNFKEFGKKRRAMGNRSKSAAIDDSDNDDDDDDDDDDEGGSSPKRPPPASAVSNVKRARVAAGR